MGALYTIVCDYWKSGSGNEPRPPPEPPPARADDRDALVYPGWLVAKLVLMPKKGDLGLCSKWRATCLLDVSSKTFSTMLVARMHKLIEKMSPQCQDGFRGRRGARDSLWTSLQALKKRQEHQQASWVCFLDLVRAFDTVNRQLLFDVASKMGVPRTFSTY